MIEYGQFCPVSKAAEVLGERWTFLIVRGLLGGATRFNTIHRGVSKISPTVLNKRLQELEAAGILVKKRIPDQRGYEYHLTECGRDLGPLVMGLGEWGMKWARSTMSDEELDVQLLMFDISNRINPEGLPGGRTLLKWRYTDLDEHDRWWIKVEGDVDLCTDHPGGEVDINFVTDLRTMTEVWIGDLSLREARASKRLMITGPTACLSNLSRWLPLSAFSGIRPGEMGKG
ncbi:MAG: helix-turn-helix transcriptional regulator [Nitrospirota bacterium]|nr:helix-turn-helix transcriptional regulator [Nitrospirota bacterium]